MRQTRALPACSTTKTLQNQLSAVSPQLSAFSLFAGQLPRIRKNELKAES
jgi:hypothetical protein